MDSRGTAIVLFKEVSRPFREENAILQYMICPRSLNDIGKAVDCMGPRWSTANKIGHHKKRGFLWLSVSD